MNIKEGESFPKPDTQFCPYWRRIVTYQGNMLALCGVTSKKETKEEIVTDSDLWSRTSRCPYYEMAKDKAYLMPCILEIESSGVKVIARAWSYGKHGVEQLEWQWSERVEDFYKKHQEDI